MVTTELGACEWFVWDLRRSNLIDRGQLDQVVGEFLGQNPKADPPALAEYLVTQGILSQFQADRLLQGKTQGFVLGPFTLMDALGSGSMGTVYKAVSKTDNKWYAVKVLPRRSMWNVRIARRKVRLFEQCRHPTVVPFVDVGTAGGMHYLAWPFVEGETLDHVVQRQGKLNPGEAARIALQTAEGLDACHQQGLFHGLLKPSNLMTGPNQRLHILDFGIGCLLAETEGESLVDTMSTANSVASGLDCASPESIMDPTNLTPAGDQYSLGCILYYSLTGQFPFPDGSAAEKMMAHQFKQPVPIRERSPEVPAELVEVVERLMQKAPEARFPSAADVVAALRPFADGTGAASSHAQPQPARTPTPTWDETDNSQPPLPSFPEVPAASKPARPAARPQPARAPAPAVRAPAASAPSGLPNRRSLRGAPAPTIAEPPAKSEVEDSQIIQDLRGEFSAPRRTWEERLGPVGITVGALVACALAWLLTWKLF
jgi:serine/threonine-protein kinase